MPLINQRLIDTQLSVGSIPPAHHKILSEVIGKPVLNPAVFLAKKKPPYIVILCNVF